MNRLNKVRLSFRPILAQSLGIRESPPVLKRTFAPGESLADVLGRLAAEYPEVASKVYDVNERNVKSLVQISINGRLLSLAGGVEVPLSDGDEVLIFYAAGGG